MGVQPVVYWDAIDGPTLLSAEGGTGIDILRHRSREAAAASWAKFSVDPKWLALRREIEKDGVFVATQEHTFMKLTNFYPMS